MADPYWAAVEPQSKLSKVAYGGQVRSDNRRPPRDAPLMRKYAVACLSANGSTVISDHIAPVDLGFDAAFSALSQSALVYSPRGPIQAQDLVPGDVITCADGETARVVWIGSMTGIPNIDAITLPDFRLYRVSSDAFGLDCPMGDTILGPGAVLTGGRFHNTPVAEAADGEVIFEVFPQSPVGLLHVMLDRPGAILVNGLAVKAFVPTLDMLEPMGQNGRALFASLFRNLDLGRMVAAV